MNELIEILSITPFTLSYLSEIIKSLSEYVSFFIHFRPWASFQIHEKKRGNDLPMYGALLGATKIQKEYRLERVRGASKYST